MVKILCVSDTTVPQLESSANLRRRYADIELVVSCGDLPSVYLEYIVSILNVPLLYVRGNHDEHYDEKPPGGDDLHNRVVEYQGIRFAGIEGSMRYNKGLIQYTDSQIMWMTIWKYPRMMLRQWQGKPVDVLVTHSPAKGIHDAPDKPHNGFKGLLSYMKWYRPRYMLHGHVHTYDRRKTTRTQHGDTCIININPFTVLDIDPVEKQ